MSTLSIPNTATPLATILSADYNANFSAVSAWANGNITQTNLGSMTGAITWAVTSNVLSLSGTNVGTEGTIKFTHSGILAASKAALWITSSAVQTTGHALGFFEQLNASASIPALKVSSTAAASGALSFDVSSTTAPSRPVPSMTTAQKAAITSPPTGAQVYDTDLRRNDRYDGVAWSSLAGQFSVLLKNTDYTATASDDYLSYDVSGASRTVTLPASASNKGRTLWVEKTDTTFNTLTIDGNGAELVGGAATTVLHTQGEKVRLYYDGTNVLIIERIIPSKWFSYTPTITGCGSVTLLSFFWRRVGDSQEIRGTWKAPVPAASLMSVTLAGGVSVDSAKYAQLGGRAYVGTYNNSEAAGGAGVWTNARGGVVTVQNGDFTKLEFNPTNNTDGTNSGPYGAGVNGSTILGTNGIMAMQAIFPVSGWNS